MIGKKNKREQKINRYKELIEKEFNDTLEDGETAELYNLEKELNDDKISVYHKGKIALKKALNRDNWVEDNADKNRKRK